MSLADLFVWTQSSIFGNLADQRAGGSQIHRNLQRAYARLLTRMITTPEAGTPWDAQALARRELTELDGRVKRALAQRGLGVQTRAHLEALQTDVERALEARTVLPEALSD